MPSLTPYKIKNPSKATFLEIIGPDTVTTKPNSMKKYQVSFLGVGMGQVEQITETTWGYFAGGRDNIFPSLQEASEARCRLMLIKESYLCLPKLRAALVSWAEAQQELIHA